jgi:hypothetical protein
LSTMMLSCYFVYGYDATLSMCSYSSCAACTDRLVIAEVEVDERNRGVGRGRVCSGAWRLVLFCLEYSTYMDACMRLVAIDG